MPKGVVCLTSALAFHGLTDQLPRRVWMSHARARGQAFDLVLTRVLERLLNRLGRSGVAHRFILKGAMLVITWFEARHRGTRDLDLLEFGDPDPSALAADAAKLGQ